MAGSVNKAILLGNLTKDPDIRSLADGKEIASLSLATNESWKGKDGTYKEKVEFHKIVIFNPHLVTLVKNSTKKGSKLYVEGTIQNRKYTNKEGKDAYITEIVLQPFSGNIQLLDSKQEKPNYSEDEEYASIPY